MKNSSEKPMKKRLYSRCLLARMLARGPVRRLRSFGASRAKPETNIGFNPLHSLPFSQASPEAGSASSPAKEGSNAPFANHKGLLSLAWSAAVARNSLATSRKVKVPSSICLLEITR